MTSPAVAPAPPPAGAAVLLVDDRPENLLALEAVLAPLVEETGARLLRAGGADEALRHVLRDDGAIAVVLLDVVMPGTDGLETARLIRARRTTEHVPIIFVTALEADRRRVTLGYQFGAVDYLTKPLDPEVLRAKVRAFLELHRRRGEAVVRERRRYADAVQALREAALRDEAALVTTIQRIGTALASELDLARIVQLVTDEATALTGARFGAFFYTTGDADRGEALTLYTLAGVPRDQFAEFPHPRATPVFAPTFRGEGVVRSADITRDPRYGQLAPHFGMPEGHPPVRSYLAVPVRSRGGEVLGGLFFGHDAVGVFGEREERLVLGVSGWAAVAIDNARLYAAERGARQAAEAARSAAEAAQAGAEAASREAQAANEAKSGFLATMSHELRTPVNAILGYAQLLELGLGGPLTPAQRGYVDRLAVSGQHLLGLINDVLDLSKIEAGELRVATREARTGALVRATLDLVAPSATARGVRLIDAGPADDGVPFVGDEDRVRQVVLNLLSNAVKFTASGGTITVASETVPDTPPGADRLDGRGPWAVVRVADTGIGIEPEEQGRIFEPFHQVDGGHTRTQGGTGLGLAISRRLARLMGGDLTVESTPGVGSTFALWLPAAGGGAGQAAETVAERSARATSHASRFAAPGLRQVGELLRELADDILSTYADRLRADPALPHARALRRSQLEDHQVSLLGDLAQSLVIVAEASTEADAARGGGGAAVADLLRDGSAIQRVIAEHHGARRHAQGWSEAELRRDYRILREEVERAVLARGGRGATEAGDALRVLLGLIDRSEGVSVRGWHRAAEDSGRGDGDR